MQLSNLFQKTAVRLSVSTVVLSWLLLYAADLRAQCGDAACLHAGTTAVSITNSQSQLLDSTMSSVLGQTVDLTPTQHQALANASVNVQSLLATLQAQGLASSATGALTAPLTVTQLSNAIEATLGSNTAAAGAVHSLGSQASGVSGQVALSSILTGDTTPNILSQSNVNALDLVNAIVATNNVNTERPVQSVNTTGSALNLGANFGAITIAVVVLDKPVFVCGPAGAKFYSASIRVRLHTALANQGVNLELGLASVKVGLTALDLVVAVARASGTLKTINALTSALTIEATPGVAELYLGTVSDSVLRNGGARLQETQNLGYAGIGSVNVTLLGSSASAFIDVRGYALGVTPTPSTLSFTGPYPQTRTATTSSTFVSQLVTSLLNSLELRISAFVGGLDVGSILTNLTTLILNTLKTPTNGLLATPVSSLLSGVVDPLLTQLGLGLGRVDVTVDRAFQVSAGSACDDLQYCTDNDLCSANGVCAGTPRVCDDSLGCTTDSCDEGNMRCAVTVTSGCAINGVCYAEGAANPANPCQSCVPATSKTSWTNKSIGSSCSDGQYCTMNDACNLLGSCVGTPRDCNDGLLCTMDACDEATSACTNTLTLGCAISGACYLPGVSNPANNCQSCNPGASQTAWSNKSQGTTCNDNLYCTDNDTCDGSGNCKSTARSCSDNLSCTLDVCNEALGSCSSTPSGSCVILGQCYGAGTPNPLNPCLECNPQLSATSWSQRAVGSSCSDGAYCTTNDACNALGVCTGPARDCSDGLSCTVEVCDELNDRCNLTLTLGCVIAGQCVGSGVEDPANPCQACNPVLSINSWSNKIVNTPCSDGLYCTEIDVCDGNGTCSGGARSCGTGVGCSAGVCNEATDSCSAVVPGCNILGTCYASGASNPSNSCQVCAPQTSTSTWSQKAQGESCSDGAYCTTDDKCTALGACVGTIRTCAADPLSCTDEVCNELTHTCEPVIREASCLIGLQCVAADGVNPDNPCQRCVPLTSMIAWTDMPDNSSCSDGLHCTENDKCTAGACVGTARNCASAFGCATGTCNETTDTCDTVISGCLIDDACYVAAQANPQNPCQVCDPIKSKISWSAKTLGAVCSDGLYCTVDDACNGTGTCATKPRDCADALGCTVDVCNESGQACVSSTLTSCLIGNGCVDANTVNPTNDCELCVPGTSTSGWSAKGIGSGCSDGKSCTSNDQCQGDRTCLGTALPCDDGLICTRDECDETTVACKVTVLQGCAIGNACFAAGMDDPMNSCRSCVPDVSSTTWTNKPATAVCSDGKFCTVDQCNGAGACVTTPLDCNDNVACTTDSCDEDNDRCVASAGDSCLIDGQCVASGAVDPLNDCMACIPGVSSEAWSNRPAGDACTGGVFCLQDRTCNGMGVCLGNTPRNCDDNIECSVDTCDEATDSCMHTSVDSCVVDGACTLVGTPHPTNACKVCNPLLDATAWSTVPSEACLGLDDPDADGFITNVECPMGIAMCPDTDQDGKLDFVDPDDDGDTVYTRYERKGDFSTQDTDQDGKPDHLDPDDDNDSLETRSELPDPSADGDPADARDDDDDDKPDYLDSDDDDDGISTKLERDDATELGTSWDEDEDGAPNWLDTDSDGDSYSDRDEEMGDGDLNDDDVPDYLQPYVPSSEGDAGVDGDAGTDAGADAGQPGDAGGGGTGGTGGEGGEAGSGERGGEGGSDAPDAAVPSGDAGAEPTDAGYDSGTSAVGQMPDASEPAADSGAALAAIQGGLAGGSSRCSAAPGVASSVDLSVWLMAFVGGLLVWRKRRV